MIHLHCDALVASTRQGNYADALAGDSHGKIVLKRVAIPVVNGEPDWNSPVAKRFGITSVPQFWFYGKTGKPIKRLTDRFAEEDIDAAFKSALRGR